MAILKKKMNRSLPVTILLFLFLAAMGAFIVISLVFAVNNAFKPLDELFIFPPRFFVRNPTFDNFFDLVAVMDDSWVPLTRYFFNTIVITVLGTGGHVILASMAAYPLSKYRFPGSKAIFQIVVLALMFSPHEIGRAHVWNSSHVAISYAFFCLNTTTSINR